MATEEEVRMAFERAERFCLAIRDEHLSFPKCMRTSEVKCGYWLSLPSRFCADNLPDHDARVTLVDAIEEEYETRYLHGKKGLSSGRSGWKKFALDHDVLPGDTCVFELTGPTTFRVYVFRAEDEDD